MKKAGMLGKLLTATATKALSRAYRMTYRMPIEVIGIERGNILLIAPHADDEVIGAGGALCLHREAGSAVTVAFATVPEDPPAGTILQVRHDEACAAGELLSFKPVFLGYPDGSLMLKEKQLAASIADLITRLSPDVIFCPFPGDHHRDHQSCSHALAQALKNTKQNCEVWSYELWSTLWPNKALDISAVIDGKREAIELYASQVATMPYAEAAIGLNRYRGLKVHVAFAEAYFVTSSEDFAQLTDDYFKTF